jgi:hypothetical protein
MAVLLASELLMVVRIVVPFCETIVKNNINCCRKIHAAGGGNIDSIATITDDIFPQTVIFGAKNIESSRRVFVGG